MLLTNRTRHAFTLIELLIVVAIIAILAAIAVPNFLEAQTRSKVSRAKADMRSIATALESYTVDNRRYPPDAVWVQANEVPTPPQELWSFFALRRLTTPIAYMTSISTNPFFNKTDNQDHPSYFRYFAKEWKEAPGVVAALPPDAGSPREWALVSPGPNGISNLGEWLIWGEEVLNSRPGLLPYWGPGCLYDPTNGTVSAGDIVRVGP